MPWSACVAAFVRVAMLLFAAILSAPAAAFDTEEAPFPGMVLKHHVAGGQDVWVLRVDLCAPGVRVRATADGERGQTVRSFAQSVGAQAAINGDFFATNGSFHTHGPAAHDGAFWGGSNHDYVAPVSFGSAHVDIPLHSLEGPTPAWAREVVSGHPTLLDDGRVVGNPDDSLCTNRHPRTALGITADHRTLIALVVDGRRDGAHGMLCDEMAFVLALEGATDAVALDGGGSSTLVVGGQVKNVPSDGHQRTVSNHLAFFAAGSGPSPQCPDFVDPVCEGNANLQRCEGTFLTSCDAGAPVAHGDCGFFGAGCSTQGGLAHCVHPFCLQNLDGGEDGSFCADATKIATCTLGRYDEGDCGFYGGLCSEAGGTATDAHCVHFLCHTNLDGGEDGTFCKDAATLSTCTLGAHEERACARGCVVDRAGARCEEDPPVVSDGGVSDDVDGGVPADGEGSDVDARDDDEERRLSLPRALTSGCTSAGTAPMPGMLGVLLALGVKRLRRWRSR